MLLALRVTDGPEAGRQFECAGDNIILVGCAKHVHFRFRGDDKYMSSVHCLLEIHSSSCLLRDLKSTNGTFVNGKRVSCAELKNGDEIKLGSTRIRVELLEESSPALKTDIYCVRCGKHIKYDGDAIARLMEEPDGFIYKCRVCRVSEAEEQERLRKVEVSSRCMACGQDVSANANADGRAAELQEVASYLCESCMAKWTQWEVSEFQIGDYLALARLEEGRNSETFMACHELTGRLVALKKLYPASRQEDGRAFAWFKREINVARELRHRSIVRCLDSGVYGDQHYFVSELMHSGDLNRALEKFQGKIPPRLALRYIVPILEALEYAHERGFVHRNIKPGNILLTRATAGQEEVAKLGDFGLTKSFLEAGNSFLTDAGEVRGTPFFMSREQILDYKFVGPTADIYATGMTLYYILSGTFPFDLSPEAKSRPVVEVILEDLRVPLRDNMPNIHKALADIVDKSVRPDLESRFQSAKELKEALLEVEQIL